MIDLGYTVVVTNIKANNWKGRVSQLWFHFKACWYVIRYGGIKITNTAPNYISREGALRLVQHVMRQYMEGEGEDESK